MNTKEQAIILSDKISSLMDENRGNFTLIFWDRPSIDIKLLRMDSSLTIEGLTCVLHTFTTNINDLTEYDIFIIKDVR